MGVKSGRGDVEVVKLSNLRAAKQDGTKFTREQREQLRASIAELRLKGSSFSDIGVALNISTSYAYTEYKVVEQRWRANANASLLAFKQQELARIDLVEKEAWLAYERSQGEQTEFSNEFSPDENGNPELVKTRGVRKARDGDPRWLAVILNCVDRRIKLLGLDHSDLKGQSGNGSVVPSTDNLTDRLQKYQGVFGFAIVAGEDASSDRQGAGEPLDSERPASEAGRIFDAVGRIRETTS